MDPLPVGASATAAAHLGLQLAQDLFRLAADVPGVESQINRIAQAFVDLNVALAGLGLALQPGQPAALDPQTCTSITALADRLDATQKDFHGRLNKGSSKKRSKKVQNQLNQLKALFPGTGAAERLAEMEWMKNTLALVAAIVRLALLKARQNSRHRTTSVDSGCSFGSADLAVSDIAEQTCDRIMAETLASAVIAYVKEKGEDDAQDDDVPPPFFPAHTPTPKETTGDDVSPPDQSDAADLIFQFIQGQLADIGDVKSSAYALPSSVVDWLLRRTIAAVAELELEPELQVTCEPESPAPEVYEADDLPAEVPVVATPAPNTGAKRKSKKRSKIDVYRFLEDDGLASAEPTKDKPLGGDDSIDKDTSAAKDKTTTDHEHENESAPESILESDLPLPSSPLATKDHHNSPNSSSARAHPSGADSTEEASSDGERTAEAVQEYRRGGFPPADPFMRPVPGTVVNTYYPFPPAAAFPPFPPPNVFDNFAASMAYFPGPAGGFPPGFDAMQQPYFNNYGGNFQGYNAPFPNMPPPGAGMPRPMDGAQFMGPVQPPRAPPPTEANMGSALIHGRQMRPPMRPEVKRPYEQEPVYYEEPRRQPDKAQARASKKSPASGSDDETTESGRTTTAHRREAAEPEPEPVASKKPAQSRSKSPSSSSQEADSRERKGSTGKERAGRQRKESSADRDVRERTRDERPRDEKAKDEKARDDSARDDRVRDERPRDERPRNEKPKEDRPREDRPREDRPRDYVSKDDRLRDDKLRDDRMRDDRIRDDRMRDDRIRDDRVRDDRMRDDRIRDDRVRDDRIRDDRMRDDRLRDDRLRDDRLRDYVSRDDRRDDRSRDVRPRDERPRDERPRDGARAESVDRRHDSVSSMPSDSTSSSPRPPTPPTPPSQSPRPYRRSNSVKIKPAVRWSYIDASDTDDNRSNFSIDTEPRGYAPVPPMPPSAPQPPPSPEQMRAMPRSRKDDFYNAPPAYPQQQQMPAGGPYYPRRASMSVGSAMSQEMAARPTSAMDASWASSQWMTGVPSAAAAAASSPGSSAAVLHGAGYEAGYNMAGDLPPVGPSWVRGGGMGSSGMKAPSGNPWSQPPRGGLLQSRHEQRIAEDEESVGSADTRQPVLRSGGRPLFRSATISGVNPLRRDRSSSDYAGDDERGSDRMPWPPRQRSYDYPDYMQQPPLQQPQLQQLQLQQPPHAATPPPPPPPQPVSMSRPEAGWDWFTGRNSHAGRGL